MFSIRQKQFRTEETVFSMGDTTLIRHLYSKQAMTHSSWKLTKNWPWMCKMKTTNHRDK